MVKEAETRVQSSKEKISNGYGILIILTGFTGAGKTAIEKLFIERNPSFKKLVTTNSRQARPGEIDGQHYHFISEEQFLEGIEKGDFLEYEKYPAEKGFTYRGTTKKEFEKLFNGQNLISSMEQEGAGKFEETIRREYKDKADEILSRVHVVFVDGGDENELLRRFIQRGGNAEEFRKRIKRDRESYEKYRNKFRNRIFNYFGRLDYAAAEAEEILGLPSRKKSL